MPKNLIKNPCGEEGLKHWEDVQHGGDGWKVEALPGDNMANFPFQGKFFATSFELCSKSQVIDLLKEGYTEEKLDAQPHIVVSEWHAARTDCECSYDLSVQLLSGTREVIGEFSIKYHTIPSTDGSWRQIKHTFWNYGPGVRFIKFTHSGKDTRYWKGWFGVRMINSSVTIEA
ncbi:F-box only protein 2-like [Anomaloglossus baeobatrachus]|uniref:F-box only protein 2-like n=1 Tax=Anomaloglossus baeobatrachus TaxID=238106 RepID=UPI003F4F4AE7